MSARTVASPFFGIYPERINALACALETGSMDLGVGVRKLLRRPDGSRDALALALLEGSTIESFTSPLAATLGCDEENLGVLLREELSALDDCKLSGADLVTLAMADVGVSHVVAYPGTSELALCNAILRSGSMALVNGRGDTETVFISAGLSLSDPCSTVALVHGARGGTNALGAIAVARRNETGLVCIVGMASVTSQPYLPPHSEFQLIEGLKHFAKDGWVLPGPVATEDEAFAYVSGEMFRDAFYHAFLEGGASPRGPIIVGLPQDSAEVSWIPFSCWRSRPPRAQAPTLMPDALALQIAARAISEARHPLFIIDDAVFREDGAIEALCELTNASGAECVQVAYRRGPMLFQQATQLPSSQFLGLFDPENEQHSQALRAADLIVTFEDRNAYPRVFGQLPACAKLAITSNREMTAKNGYLRVTDRILVGSVAAISRELALLVAVNRKQSSSLKPVHVQPLKETEQSDRMPPRTKREILVWELARSLRKQKDPIIVDDSQMLGGVVAESYRYLPKNLRVYGDHSGFVGGGLGHAVGVALRWPKEGVWCLVGDQGFTNGMQALVAAGEYGANIKIILCDNGKSVSLLKQATARDQSAFDTGKSAFLHNAANLDYLYVAGGMGVQVWNVDYDDWTTIGDGRDEPSALERAFEWARLQNGPLLIRLSLPSTVEFWDRIWMTTGRDGR